MSTTSARTEAWHARHVSAEPDTVFAAPSCVTSRWERTSSASRKYGFEANRRLRGELSALATPNVSGAPYVALRRHSTRSGQSSCARSARSERRLAARERQGVGASSERLKRRYALSLGELFIRGAGELVQQARSRYDAGSSRACASLSFKRAQTRTSELQFSSESKSGLLLSSNVDGVVCFRCEPRGVCALYRRRTRVRSCSARRS